VTQAIVVLGFATVKSLAVGASVFRALNARGQKMIDPTKFFHHSLMTAMAARMVIERDHPQKGGTVFAAGILHDVGKLVVAEFLGNAMPEILERVGGDVLWEEAEREVLGLTHSEIGFWFASRWKFPGELADAVRWHHDPAEAVLHRDHASAVHLGDVIAHRSGATGSGRRDVPEPSAVALQVLHVDEGMLAEFGKLVSGMVIDERGAGITLGM
jgi:putative nucleotidyltransferase with HDIG domain